MSTIEDHEQANTWEILYQRAREILQQFGREDYLGRADYHVLADNYGFTTINVAFHKLQMLQQPIITLLQQSLLGHPDWAIQIAIDIPGKEDLWPRMGLAIRSDEVIDELQRQYFPTEFQSLRFENGKG
jgi:hypothetical protein